MVTTGFGDFDRLSFFDSSSDMEKLLTFDVGCCWVVEVEENEEEGEEEEEGGNEVFEGTEM